MHDTSHPLVKFHLDQFIQNEDSYTLKGWILHGEETIKSLIVKWNENEAITSLFHDRPDVFEVYKPKFSKLNYSTGFEISFKTEEDFKNITFSCIVSNSTEDVLNDIVTSLNPYYHPNKPDGKIANIHPSIIAVDNFYDNPDEIRDYALNLDFQYNKEYHKGQRTRQKTFFKGTREFLEDALKKKITSWDNQPHNGVFQFCTAEDKLVYHTDAQTYAAVVFLTPNAPVECGTSFFKHKANNLRRFPTEEDCIKFNKSSDELYWDMFQGNFYDKTPWELVDTVGNVYNRMAIWDAKLVHAATQYFGSDKLNSRLFHMFFFDAE